MDLPLIMSSLLVRSLPRRWRQAPLSPVQRRCWRCLACLLPTVCIEIRDDAGMRQQILAMPARQGDYRVLVAVASGTIAFDLFLPYLQFVAAGHAVYCCRQQLARSYVQCGACLQDIATLQIRISAVSR